MMTAVKKILVIDDDVKVRRLVALTLGDGYQLLQAPDGQDGLEIAAKEKPDLILLDVRMPRLNGLEVCRRLKKNSATSDIIVVMLTGLDSDADLAAATEAGAEAYFVKPFSPRDLLDKITDLLDR